MHVAPRAGAWIETGRTLQLVRRVLESLPVRERGLKPQTYRVHLGCNWSLPVRERGLKLILTPPKFFY